MAAVGSGGDRDLTTDGLQINEGDSVTLTLTANGLTAGRVLGNLNYGGGTAIYGQNEDYFGPNAAGTQSAYGITHPATTQAFTITTRANNDPDGDRTFVFSLPANPVHLDNTGTATGNTWTNGAPTSITVTILDDDSSASTFAIAVDDANTTEGDTAEFTVTFTAGVPAPTYPVTVDWAVGGDVDNADYTVSGGTGRTLTFNAAGSQTINIGINADLAAESSEDLTVTLSNAGSGTSITTAEATTTIAANTLARRLTLSGPATVAEGTDAIYTVTLTGTVFGSATDVTWMVDHAATAGTENADFANADGGAFTGSSTVSFGANDRSRTFTLAIVDDDADNPGEMAERFTVTITAPDAASEVSGGGVTTTIAAPASGDEATHELLLPEVTRAVADGVFGAVAARAGEFHVGGGAAGFSLNGRSNWSDIVANQARALAAGDGALSRHPRSPSPRHPRSLLSGGDIDAKQLLRGLEFASPVSMGASHGGHGDHGHAANLAFWGGSDYRDFGGEDGDDDWDGSVFSLRFGVDGAVRDNLRAGLMLSYSDAETEYTRIDSGTTTTGDYELEMTSVSPYLRWNLGGGHAWASVSYGSGEVEVRPDDGETAANDVTMTGAAFGGGRKLLAQGGRELSLRADAFVASSEVDGDGDANAAGIDDDLDVDANRVRVALAWSYPGRFADGRLAPAFDLGLRHDGGDGRTGAGLELGGALRYRAADAGLTLEGNARALLGHSGDHRGWGIGGLVRVQNGADGQGLAVSIAPSYGGIGDALGAAGSGYAGDGLGALWRGGAAGAGKSAAPVARLDAEVGYGMPVSGGSRFGRAFGFDAGAGLFGDGMLTPYSALRFSDTNRDYRLGLRWNAARLDLDLFARHANGTAADNALAIEGQLRF